MGLMKFYLGVAVYDIKYITSVHGLHGGLERVSKLLGVNRIAGNGHQAGPNSLLTLQTLIEFKNIHRKKLNENFIGFEGMLSGLCGGERLLYKPDFMDPFNWQRKNVMCNIQAFSLQGCARPVGKGTVCGASSKLYLQFSQRVAGTNNSAGADSKQIVPERKTAAINVPNSFLLQPREVQSALHHRYNSHSVLSLSRGNEVPKSSYSCFKDMPPIFDDITPMPPRLNRQQSAASSPWKGSVDSQEKVADDVEKFETAFSGDTTAANEDDSDSDALPDTDDYDSEASPRSPESCKKSKWFKKFLGIGIFKYRGDQ
ncbi:hypothetical protein GH714_028705 [Hevea brasiliensis]|uniref:Uncharacterized protein n=1 Tax=Hevea brasiliensis TaxID=3981 RepID=A0A6A6LME9_HEVBR|nr:hypothetical protein GH714_028705 [Hevea brasiliensis]